MSAMNALIKEMEKLDVDPERLKEMEIIWSSRPKGIFYLFDNRAITTRDPETIDLMKLVLLEGKGNCIYKNTKKYRRFLLKTIPLRAEFTNTKVEEGYERLPVSGLENIYERLGDKIESVGKDSYKQHLLTRFEMGKRGNPSRAFVYGLEKRDLHPLSLEIACCLSNRGLNYFLNNK